MRQAVVLMGALMACSPALAQQSQDQDLAMHLRQLGAAAEALEAKLPAFACHESLASEEIRGGKVKRHVQAEGDLRIAARKDGKMDEQFTVTAINGKPAKPGDLRMPLFVRGGFQHALSMFRPEDQACFDYRLSGQLIDIKSRETASEACREKTDFTATALMDEKGLLTHFEFSAPVDVAESRHLIPSAALDFSPADLGGTKFLLSTHVVAQKPVGKSTYRFEASYTGCQLYKATVRIGDATAITGDGGK
jgi:hypothetical protein